MKQEKKIYNLAFKRKTVELGNQRSNITELSREFIISDTMLYKQRKDHDEFEVGSFFKSLKLN